MVSVNSMWCSILIHTNLTVFGIENLSGAKGAGKVLILIIIYYLHV